MGGSMELVSGQPTPPEHCTDPGDVPPRSVADVPAPASGAARGSALHRKGAVAVVVLSGLVASLLMWANGGSVGDAVEEAVAAGPGRDSARYREPPLEEVQRVARLVQALLRDADRPAVGAGMRLHEAHDERGRSVRVLSERADDKQPRGMGLYAVLPDAGLPAGLVVEVPHPRADRWTERIGALLFARAEADALLVATAHRTAADGAADVAHEERSVFAAVDRAVVGRGTVVVQIHGFDGQRRDTSHEVIVSSTTRRGSPVADQVARALEGAGFRTCVYGEPGCRLLGGTRNVQGAHARTVGAHFVHLELSAAVRLDTARHTELVDALSTVL